MAINLPDIIPFNFKQFNNGLTLADGNGDTLPLVLDKLNENVNKTATHLREKLYANRSYYVSNSTGLSINTGLSSTSSLNTIKSVLDIIYNKLDLNDFVVTINLADGVYNEFIKINETPVGTNNNQYPIVIEGNVSNPDLVKWTYNNNINGCCISLQNQSRLLLKNLSFDNISLSSTNVNAIKCNQSTLSTENVFFNAFGVNNDQIYLNESVFYYNTIKVEGINKRFINANNSTIISNGINCTWLFETAVLYALIKLTNGSIAILNNITFTGSAIGRRYEKDYTSNIIATTYPVGLISQYELDATINSNLTINNSVNISNLLTVQRDTLLNEDLYVSLNSYVGGNFVVTGNTNLTGPVSANILNVNGTLITSNTTLSTFNGGIKVLNGAEFLGALFKDEVVFQGKATFNQELVALGTVNLPNGVISKSNLSASTSTGVVGANGDVLVSNNTAVNGLVWSNKLTQVESNLNLKANLLNPTFEGVPTVPTPARTANTQQIANTAYVNDLINFTVNQIMTWVQERVPTKMITAWSGNVEDIKAPWFLADGTNGTPDLRNRFVMGAGKQTGSAFCINEVGGSASDTITLGNVTTSTIDVNIFLESSNVALTKDQIPSHTHFGNLPMLYYGGGAIPIYSGSTVQGGKGSSGSTSSVIAYMTPVNENTVGLSQTHSHTVVGKAQPHSHTINLPSNTINTLPPYYVLAYVELKPTTYTFTVTA